MAFAYTVTDRGVFGDRKYAYGTFTNTSGSSGGDITPGFNIRTDHIQFTSYGSAVDVAQVTLNETLPKTGALTIVTTADVDGVWFAIGK